jgi:hypothetical protein
MNAAEAATHGVKNFDLVCLCVLVSANADARSARVVDSTAASSFEQPPHELTM